MEALTIGQLARLTGVSAKAIRYYEAVGLLPAPPRARNHYRRYGIADVNRLHLLRRIRLLDVPLAVARPLLVGATDARCVEVQRELLALVRQRLASIDHEIAELHRLRETVEGYQRALAACDASPDEAFRACTDMACIAVASDDAHEGETHDADYHAALV